MTTTAQEVKRVPTSEDLLHPGDFVFIPKREPIRSFESEPIPAPNRHKWSTFFAWLKWRFVGPRFELKPIFTPIWPNLDTVIINCPICNGSVGTTMEHVISSVDPLTIETPITCPYCRTFTFKVVGGKIMLA